MSDFSEDEASIDVCPPPPDLAVVMGLPAGASDSAPPLDASEEDLARDAAQAIDAGPPPVDLFMMMGEEAASAFTRGEHAEPDDLESS